MKRYLPILLLAALPSFAAQRLTFDVVGIDCDACAPPVMKALSSVPGVQNARVDPKKKTATVDVPDNFDRAAIRSALSNAGFEAVFPGEKTSDIQPLPADVVARLDIAAHKDGKKIDLASLVVPGKITIVDWYGDWCGPCRVLESRLERYMQANGDIALRRVDIGKWDNEAAKQATHDFRLEALPYIRVYDGKGKFVTAVTGGMWDEVLAAIAKARTR